jgi:hypothetical protein
MMTKGQVIYHEGRLALLCSLFGAVFGIAAIVLWMPLPLIALYFFARSGWHIGAVIKESWF